MFINMLTDFICIYLSCFKLRHENIRLMQEIIYLKETINNKKHNKRLNKSVQR